MKPDWRDLLAGAGAITVVAGMAMIHIPTAIILAGAGLIVLGLLLSSPE